MDDYGQGRHGSPERMMWTTVYVAATPRDATTLRAALQRAGFLVSMRLDPTSARGGYEVKVPDSEAAEAGQQLAAWLGRGLLGQPAAASSTRHGANG